MQLRVQRARADSTKRDAIEGQAVSLKNHRVARECTWIRNREVILVMREVIRKEHAEPNWLVVLVLKLWHRLHATTTVVEVD